VFFRRPIASMLAKDRRVLGLILLGTLPAVAVVLICKIALDEAFEATLKSPLLAGFMLPVTGFSLLWAQRRGAGTRDYHQLTTRETLLIGAAQAAAILPGLSRSGSTIAAGLGLGLSRSAAATYSFLLAIPALAGAGLYEGVKALGRETVASTSTANLAIGAAVAFAVGLAALSLLRRVVERGRLHYFGWYCIVLGVIVIALHWPR
jgi:undecaprenyl-diphosphatase